MEVKIMLSGQMALDFSEIRGQEHVKRACEVAAAGGHNLLIWGFGGLGKTALALATCELFGDNYISLDRTTKANTLDKIPNECKAIVIDRFDTFSPELINLLADILEFNISTTIATMLPCYCGFYGHHWRACTCSQDQIADFYTMVRPITSQCEINVQAARLEYEQLSDSRAGETSASVAARVTKARNLQEARLGNNITNADMSMEDVTNLCKLDSASANLLKQATRQLNLTGRAYFSVLKLARTIADLAESEKIQAAHIAESIQYRSKDM
jgi:magnesium chelatase family protein